jgi:hypothetical protein
MNIIITGNGNQSYKRTFTGKAGRGDHTIEVPVPVLETAGKADRDDHTIEVLVLVLDEV